MTRAHRLASAALALCAMAATARAADLAQPDAGYGRSSEAGFYLGSMSGVSLLDRTTFRPGGAVVRSDYEAGSYFGGRAGYAFGRFYGVFLPRIDVEGGYASNDVSRHAVNGVRVPGVDSFGSTSALQGYGNLYVDFDTLSAFRPYVGGGVGAADVRLRRQGISATGTLIDASDTGLAYHYDAGLGVHLDKLGLFGASGFMKGTVVEVGYRRVEAPDLRFVARDGSASKLGYATDMITFGTRKQF